MATPALAQPNRAEINRANSQHSTGPRTAAGKLRSSSNALRHGLTAQSAVLPNEDPAQYQLHCRQFADEYQPATPTESHLVQQLANTSWRLNRIPTLEATTIADTRNPQTLIPNLAALGLLSSRLSRQFEKSLDQLRALQSERRDRERREIREAAALFSLHKHKGIPWDPAAHGFVFSRDQVERHAQKLMRQNEAYHAAYVFFELPPKLREAANA